MAVKKKCTYCGIKTEDWEIVNGGPVRCWECGKKIRGAEVPKKTTRKPRPRWTVTRKMGPKPK